MYALCVVAIDLAMIATDRLESEVLAINRVPNAINVVFLLFVQR